MHKSLICLATALLMTTGAAFARAEVAATPPVNLPSFENLAENLLPTVVNISTTAKIKEGDRQTLPQLPQLPPGSPFEDFFKDFYDQFKNQQQNGAPGQERDDKISALGSGFIIDASNGYIVTNNHVIKDADEIKVILHDDTSLDATLVGTDEKTDIAVLKVKPVSQMVATKWGDSDKAKVGSWVLAIGNPFGLGGTVTAGIVSARARNINAGPYDDFIQTDASINRGNSGGPMFNTSGEVIGVNTAIFSPSGGSVGIGFAVPSNIVRGVVDQLVKFGKTKRGWLGVHIQELTKDIADSLSLPNTKGVLVASVIAKGPAEAAGIDAGDVILSFDGKEVDNIRKLPRLVAETDVGKKVDVKVWRKGAEKMLSVTLGQLETAEEKGMLGDEKPAKEGKKETPKGTDAPLLGLTLAPLTDGARATYNIDKALNGVVITDVKKDGPAAEKGLSPGDVITEVDQQEVTDPAQVVTKSAAAQKAGRGSVLLFITHGKDKQFVAVKIKK